MDDLIQSGAVVVSQPLSRLPDHPYFEYLAEELTLIKRHTFGHDVIAALGDLA